MQQTMKEFKLLHEWCIIDLAYLTHQMNLYETIKIKTCYKNIKTFRRKTDATKYSIRTIWYNTNYRSKTRPNKY